MSERPSERWRDREEEDGSPEGRAGALFRSVRPREPNAALEAKVQAVLRGETPAVRRGRPLPALAVVAIVLVVAGGATAATAIYTGWIGPEKPPAKSKPSRSAERTHARAPEKAAELPPPAPPAEVAPPQPPRAPAPERRRDPSTLALESKQIKSAVDALRSGDAAAALREISAYEAAHPNGLLHREALLTKISALVANDREAEALALLDETKLDDHPRSLELTILRGELRARAHRCTDAVGDFESALARDLESTLRARAAKGLARCRP
jgi:hypothetical protein